MEAEVLLRFLSDSGQGTRGPASLGGRDLLGFLDHLLSRFPFDPGRVGVIDRSICNWLSFFGASDIGPRFTHLELSAKPWERPGVLFSHRRVDRFVAKNL